MSTLTVAPREIIDPVYYQEHGYPHEIWAQLRREAPIALCELDDFPRFWAVTKHADIIEISKQPERFLNAPLIAVFASDVQTTEDNSDWTWIYPVARRFELEGRSVLEFLQWSATESGRAVRFADAAAELAAGQTRFSGALDISGLDPEEAVAVVLSTTRFRATPDGDALRVSRRSE